MLSQLHCLPRKIKLFQENVLSKIKFRSLKERESLARKSRHGIKVGQWPKFDLRNSMKKAMSLLGEAVFFCLVVTLFRIFNYPFSILFYQAIRWVVSSAAGWEEKLARKNDIPRTLQCIDSSSPAVVASKFTLLGQYAATVVIYYCPAIFRDYFTLHCLMKDKPQSVPE